MRRDGRWTRSLRVRAMLVAIVGMSAPLACSSSDEADDDGGDSGGNSGSGGNAPTGGSSGTSTGGTSGASTGGSSGTSTGGSSGMMYGWTVDETAPPSYDIQGLWGSGPDEVWAAAGGGDILGGAGQIHHWDGTAWELYYSMGTPGLTDVWGVNGGASVFFVGHGPQFYELSSSGIYLLEGQTGGSAVPNYAVWGSAPNAVWVASNSSSNPLRLWTGEEFADELMYRSPHLSAATAVWGSGPNDVWAADDEGILHFDGTAWTQAYATTSTYFGIHGSGPTDVWAVGPRDLVHFDGQSWRVQSGGTNMALNDVWVAGANDVWLVGEGGRILHGGTGGFTPVESGITESLFSIWGTTPTDIWAGGENGVLIHYGPVSGPTMPPDGGTGECSQQGFGCSMTPCCAPFRCTNIGGGILACA